MVERGAIIKFPLEKARVSKSYLGIVIIPGRDFLRDESILIDASTLQEYKEEAERELLDYPGAYERFLDGTQARIFSARRAHIGQTCVEEADRKRAYKQLVLHSLDKADAMVFSDFLRHSAEGLLEEVFGHEEAEAMLEQRAKAKKTPKDRSHLTDIK